MKNNKKAQFSTSTFVIAGLLFSAIIAFFVIGIAGIESEYPTSDLTSDSFSSNYNKLLETSNNVETMRSTSSSDEGLEFRGAFDVTFGSFFTVIQLVLSTLSLFVGLGSSFITDFPFIDSIVVNTFFILGGAILTTIITFRIVNAVGRNRV